jgi:putative aldouronate transport system permease protein
MPKNDASLLNKKKLLITRIFEYREIYLMMLPIVIFFLIFKYYPMYGIIVAFKNYLPSKGIIGSSWEGLTHIHDIFTAPQFFRALRNTIVISALKLFFCFPAPLIMALFLNEMLRKKVRTTVQSLIYLPNFISWVIIGEIVRIVFATGDGVLNNILFSITEKKYEFLTNSDWFYFILIISTIWKEAGWGTIIYYAGIINISTELYEAAEIDGAGRLRMAMSITLPSLAPIIIMLFVLQVGNIMNAGFDPIFNLYNKSVYDVADILDTYMYRAGIIEGEIEKGAALGLFKSVINFVLLLSSNALIKKVNGRDIYE